MIYDKKGMKERDTAIYTGTPGGPGYGERNFRIAAKYGQGLGAIQTAKKALDK
jgi:hypothetical protein